MGKKLFEDDSWIDIIMDDVYDTFYIDEEEEAKVAKACEVMKLFIMKDDKGKGKGKGKEKLVDDNEKGKEAEHQHLKMIRESKSLEDNGKRKVHDIQNRVGSVEVDLARAIKAKQVDDHDRDTLDLENRIKNLKEDFGRFLKAEAELKE
nr:hypothetical protein [Tanacetum cinerariifolium]